MRTLVCLALVAALAGCEEPPPATVETNQPHEESPPAPEPEGCSLTLEDLPGTQWLLAEGDVGTRLRFEREGADTFARYSAGSLTTMYRYRCDIEDEEMRCAELPRLDSWCRALLAASGGRCTAQQLRAWAPRATDAEIAKAIQDSEAVVAKFRDRPEWRQFVFQHNNAANKQQMLLSVQIDPEACRPVITDRYMAIFNGARLEGENLTGTASLVPNDKGELLWESCTDSADLYARKTDRHPTTAEEIDACHPTRCAFTVDEDAWFTYLGQDGLYAEDGCTYRLDIWRDGRVYRKDQPVSVVDVEGRKELRWSFSLDFDEPGIHVVSIARHKTCRGETTLEEVACTAVKVVDAPPPAAAAPERAERARTQAPEPPAAPPPPPARAATSSVSLGDVNTSKASMQASIEKVVRARSGQVKYCYDQRLKEAPDTAGQLSFEVRISSGRVTDVTTIKDTTGDAALRDCVTRKIQRWRFPSEVDDSARLSFTLEMR